MFRYLRRIGLGFVLLAVGGALSGCIIDEGHPHWHHYGDGGGYRHWHGG
jgi:hypothetical protein